MIRLTAEHLILLENRLSIVLPSKASKRNIEQITEAMVNRIPFENLDVLAGLPIQDAFEDVFSKLIVKKRGGLCFEMNALLLKILQHLEVPCYRIEAQMVVEGDLREQANHLALIAEISGKPCLVDIGDGRGIWGVLPLDHNEPHRQLDTEYWVDDIGNNTYQLQFKNSDGIQTRYQFINQPIERKAFARAKAFIQSDPQSVFHKRLIVSRIDSDARITLSEHELIQSTPQGRDVHEYPIEQREQLLLQHFGIKL
ncbi:arylamine N-acetyltransferase [Vibrio ishigakensis]|uniref:Arylamine N-acetyltransferase n=1 Tax=Vibrio ishigakensis TaxID=1481914 RepID=A0A0B8QLS6_9VIBR|nr:arylamine N-acetyltransferase [Vibrio ishigakensis]